MTRETPAQIAQSRGLPKRMGDLIGLRIRTTREMRTGTVVVAAGTLASVEHAVSWTKIHLRTDPCTCCGISALVVTEISALTAA